MYRKTPKPQNTDIPTQKLENMLIKPKHFPVMGIKPKTFDAEGITIAAAFGRQSIFGRM